MNVKHSILKFLGESIGGKILDIVSKNVFMGLTPNSKETKAEINKWNCIKLK